MSDYIPLPTELLDEILVRLPVESLIRFTSVCKSWYSLITSPSFVTKHLNHSKTNARNLLLKTYNYEKNKERYLLYRGDEKFSDEFSELEYPLSTPFRPKRIVGSCNGLICMVDRNLPSCRSIILWNPLIRKSMTLRMPSQPETPPWWFVLGFGAHPTTQEYMLVSIVFEKEDIEQPSKVELYTQGTGSWRSITCVGYPHGIAELNWSQAFVNGAIHWIAFERRVVDGLLPCSIMAFNMVSQAFSVTNMPAALVRLVNQNLVGHSIMSYGESLAVSCHEGVFCCIWVMKEYGVAESWAKLYNINLPIGLKQIIGFRKNGQVLLSTNDHRLLCYDCETKTSANPVDTESSVTFDSDTFMESIVLVKQGNGS
ncbi:F-box/kelch-repeat protein At3g23880-like [Rhododendron vialii]|uniref:F-box/kelch-repeat protein At3g23880-like n=1 Tax=Rhododendron vialii TaxID=182163 RepID=UPI00265D7FC8|nr:F-box/kelch-repeat protein At3g23880-like [Rhododendron vialii]